MKGLRWNTQHRNKKQTGCLQFEEPTSPVVFWYLLSSACTALAMHVRAASAKYQTTTMIKNWSTYNFQLEVVVGAGGVHPGDDGLWLGGDQAEAEEVRLGVQGEATHREVVFYKTWKKICLYCCALDIECWSVYYQLRIIRYQFKRAFYLSCSATPRQLILKLKNQIRICMCSDFER